MRKKMHRYVMLSTLIFLLAAGMSIGYGMQENKGTVQADQSVEETEKIILGVTCPEKFVGFSGETKMNFETYEPASEAIAFLKGIEKPLTIEVFYGSWCSDSIREVPRFIKIVDLVKNKNISVTLVGVDRSKKQPVEKTEGKQIEFVPTFIVFRDGKETGRIIESPQVSLEQDLVDILKK